MAAAPTTHRPRRRSVSAAVACLRATLGAALLALALAIPGPARAAEDEAALRSELAGLAPRIERAKAEVAAGRQAPEPLEPLLARAQALAARLDRAAPPPRPAAPGPDAEELREQADAARDQADKVVAALADLDRRLEAAARSGRLRRKLEAMDAAADLFAERATGRGQSGPAPATDGPGGATGTPVTGGGRSELPGLRSAVELAPGATVEAGDLPALRARRAELERSLSSLRARAAELDAAAAQVDGR